MVNFLETKTPSEKYLTKRGVEIRPVAGCVVDNQIIGHAKGFNRVMKRGIREKLGDDIFIRAEQSKISTDLNESSLLIKPGSGVTLGTIKEIIQARGGKELSEIWEIDKGGNGDIKIWKIPTDDTAHPPGATIEFWYRDDLGEWKRRLTA